MMSQSQRNVPLAIIGMSCRLPGADGLAEYWHLLRTGGYAPRELPPERFDKSLYFHPSKGKRNRSYSSLAALVSERPFDRAACPLPEQLIARSDTAHLTLCEVAAAACRHAQLDPFDLPLRNAGVYVGHTAASPLGSRIGYVAGVEQMAQYLRGIPALANVPSDDREQIIREIVAAVRRERPQRGADAEVNINSQAVASLISKGFGLSGPYLAVDAACASSLQALMIGARALQQGRIDMALVGGASYCKADGMVLFSQAQSLSAVGSRPFDAGADGLVPAEGYVMLIIKTLPRALADGDPIQAVIRGIGMSTDGRGKSLWVPRKEGQILAIHRAYGAEIDATALQYIEAHATSTQVGDATELHALAEALGSRLPKGKKIPIGSVKANIGHTLETAGMAGLVKTVLAMRHGIVPPAVNCERLNPEIDWEQAPFFIPTTELPWPAPEGGQPRRAGVNSFGIGGLNAHVVLDDSAEQTSGVFYSPRTGSAPASAGGAAAETEAIACIGMGSIFPGARTVEAFWDLISSGRDAKTTLPQGRWNPAVGFNSLTGKSFDSELPLGGFITDYAYDWKKHVVPPKQVANANPLQFMLLDATDQALEDAGYNRKPLDRSRVGVVVGTVFGDEFSQQLNLGLRIPEFQRTLRQILSARGAPPEAIEAAAAEFADHLLQHMPALLDETGSFTSSTLASRITKSFDLMGGALALDAGSASGLAAITAGVDFLLSGVCDMVVCAGGQRSMGLLTYETHAATGQLAAGAPRSPFDALANGNVPGEGVGVVLLKRLSDAQRDGDAIRAIIRGVGVAAGDDPRQTSRSAMTRALRSAKIEPHQVEAVEVAATAIPKIDAPHIAAIADAYASPGRRPLMLGSLTAQLGNTQAAAGMAGFIKTALSLEHRVAAPNLGFEQPASWLADKADVVKAQAAGTPLVTGADGRLFAGVTAMTDNRLVYHLIVERGAKAPGTAAVGAAQPASRPASAGPQPGWRIVRIGGGTLAELAAKASALQAQSETLFASAQQARFSANERWRLALVVDSPSSLASKLQLAAGQLAKAEHRAVLDEQGIHCREMFSAPSRVALLFSGQGSQYAGMLRELIRDYPPAAQACQEVDAAMRLLGYPTFGEISEDAAQQLGRDVWRTQVAVLLADTIMLRALESLGIRANFVAGHSFGEFAALVACGAWTLEQAIGATRARSEAIETSRSGQDSQMVSTSAPLESVKRAIGSRADLFVSHHNAPDQTVIAGRAAAVNDLAEQLRRAGFDTRPLSVPRPFHTPLMADAQEPFGRALSTAWITAPRIPLLSSVSNRFAKTTDEVRTNLVAQLTAPVHYVDLIERLAREGANVLIEVGPQQVLTRLHRRILAGGDLLIAASDNPKRAGLEQLFRVQAQMECAGALDQNASSSGGVGPVSVRARRAPIVAEFVNFDATHRRKLKMRQESVSRAQPVQEPPRREPPQVDSPQLPAYGNGSSHASGNGGSSAADSVWRQPPPASRAIAPAAASNGQSSTSIPSRPGASPAPQDLETFLIDFVVEQTGYPAEIVRLDADLEADLGIDSIKKAQLFSELREYFDVTPSDDLRLDDFPTLRHVLDFLRGAPSRGQWMQTTSSIHSPPLGGGSAQIPAAPRSAPQAMTITAQALAPTFQTSTPWESSPQFALATTAVATAPASSLSSMTVARASAPAKGPQGQDLETFLIQFVVDQTGYPAEIVRLDADLEADLGIDSIKKAQLFSELREYFDVTPSDDLRLDDFPTLRHVMNFLSKTPGKADWLDPPLALNAPAPTAAASSARAAEPPPPGHSTSIARSAEPPPRPALTFSTVATAPAAPTVVVAATTLSPPAAPRALGVTMAPDEIERFLVDFVIDQTGYPAEIVRLDADLEADLGIDSIKKAQLFSELHQHFEVSVNENVTLDDFPTLRHVLDFLTRSAVSAGSPPASKEFDAARLSPPMNAPVSSAAVAGTPVSAPASNDWTSVLPAGARPAALRPQSYSSAAYESGRSYGRQHRAEIRALLRSVAEMAKPSAARLRQVDAALANPSPWFSAEATEKMQGIADGAGVHFGNVVAHNLPAAESSAAQDAALGGRHDSLSLLRVGNVPAAPMQPATGATPADVAGSTTDTTHPSGATLSSRVTNRCVLRTMHAPLVSGAGSPFALRGAVVILGDNPAGRALERHLAGRGARVQVLPASEAWDEVRGQFAALSSSEPVAHLFLMTPQDEAAHAWKGQEAWQSRRDRGVILPFLICQDWIGRLEESKAFDGATLVAATGLGGDFGLAGNVASVESGGLTGLIKNIYVEALSHQWKGMRFKAVDFAGDVNPEAIASFLLAELDASAPDLEVGYAAGRRQVLRAVVEPATVVEPNPIAPGGVWVITGGGRGVTAAVALELGKRFGIKLHLLGSSPMPQINPEWRSLSADGLDALKTSILLQAYANGVSPPEQWSRVDKALQIDKTLQNCAAAEVTAVYHACDVSDWRQLETTLQRIRESDGPITGVLHGAAVIRDAHFTRKKLPNVQLTLGAKVDATAALMELTRHDPLRHFIGFSSVSGRFGARGQADYCVGNDLMCKQIDWFRRQRPDCKSVGIHWHAWDEIGAAMRPEIKATFASMNLRLMPPAEGIEHLLNEIAAGMPESEVAILEEEYYRREYPLPAIASMAEISAAEAEAPNSAPSAVQAVAGTGPVESAPVEETSALPARDSTETSSFADLPLIDGVREIERPDRVVAEARLDPTTDPFLVEHRFNGKPFLPAVISLEAMAEAAQLLSGRHVVGLENIEMHNGLPFHSSEPRTIQLRASRLAENRCQAQITSEFRDREGRLVDPARQHLTCRVELSNEPPRLQAAPPGKPPLGWIPMEYQSDAAIYHGPPFRCLKGVYCQYDGGFGRLIASEIGDLGGARPGSKWIVPGALLDGSMVACSTFMYAMFNGRVEIPHGIDRLRLGRLPRAGEECILRFYFRGQDARGSRCDFTLFGADDTPIFAVEGYRGVVISPGGK